MNYELAKQLKDAGFPLRKPGGERVYFEIIDEGGETRIFIYPTLSELIEACGSRFGILERDKETGAWYCVSDVDTDGKTTAEASYAAATSPEEAVATLWLALNKK